MARTKLRKNDVATSADARPATTASSAAGWQGTVAHHLLTHHRFPRPPKTYAELFSPLVEYYVYHGPSSHRVRSDGAEEAEDDDDHEGANTESHKTPTHRRGVANAGDKEKIDSAPPDDERVTGQLSLLRDAIFPQGTHPFFHRTALCVVAAEPQPLLRAEEAGVEHTRSSEEATRSLKATTTTAAGRQRKRAREAETADDGPTDQLVPSAENQGSAVQSDGVTEGEAEKLVRLLIDSGRHYLAPFTGDDDYLSAKEIFFLVRHWSTVSLSLAFSASLLTIAKQMHVSITSMVRPCAVAIPRIVEAHIGMRLAGMARPPRVLRLSRALQLSPKETQAITYTLLCHSGALLPMSSAGSLVPSSIAHHAGLTPQELTYFVMESRTHIKQGLLASDIKYRTTFMECRYAMPQEAVAALSGNDLSDEQIIKLERTALAEILAKEKQAQTATSSSPSPSSVVGQSSGEAQLGTEAQVLSAVNDAMASGDVGTAIASVMDAVAQLKRQAPSLTEDSSREPSVAGSTVDASRAGSEEMESGTLEPEEQTLDDVLEDVAERNLPSVTTTTTPAQPVQDPQRAADEPTARPQRPELLTDAEMNARDVGFEMALKDIDPFRPRSLTTGDGTGTGGEGDEAGSNGHHKMHLPYATNIEYMDESFKVLANLIKIRTAEGDMKDEDDGYLPKNKVEATLRELKGKVRVSSAIHQSRVQATMKAIEESRETGKSVFIPRIEQLCQRLSLTEMEKQIMLLMIGNVVSHDILVAINGRYVMRDGQRLLTVGYILFVLCEGLQERVTARRAFYQSSALLSNGILTLSLDGGLQRTRFNTDLMDYFCDIDRKIIDYLMGMETETSEMVPGSRLYHPQVPVSNVVLPRHTTELVLSTIEHYSLFESCRRTCGFGVGLGNSTTGLVMLFYGPSGTGKTMLANAVAHELKKRILLVNVSQFKSDGKAPEMMRFIFREAKLNDAIIFFDECESLFETRESNPLVTAVLAEFEHYDGLIVMATNKAQNMDEAMNRRISLMVEFKLPDHQLRERIWASHIPAQLQCDPDVSVEKLALNYELSGGLIRNAVLAAINHAVAREKSSAPVLRQEDFEQGARLQLRGFFLAAQRPQGSSEYYITPRRTMSDLVVEKDLSYKLEAIANLLKSRNTLFSQWGFNEESWEHQSSLYLFHGADGTGKSLAAEAIAYECGATIRLCNLSEVFLAREIHLVTVFEEARKLGAIVVFDEAQILFNHSEQSLQVSQLIQYHATRYPRPVLLLATTGSSDGHTSSSLDIPAAKLKFEQELYFPLPNRVLREKLWRQVFPDKVPLEDDVDFAKLSELPGSAKLIRAVAFSACCKVALLPVSQRRLSMKMISDELAEQRLREQRRKPASGMFA